LIRKPKVVPRMRIFRTALCLVSFFLMVSGFAGARGSRTAKNVSRLARFEGLVTETDSSSFRDAVETARRHSGITGGAELLYLIFDVSREICVDSTFIGPGDLLSDAEGAASLYVMGEMELSRRRFEDAARMFDGAVHMYLSRGDTLSSCFALLRSIECALSTRSTAEAESKLTRAEHQIGEIEEKGVLNLILTFLRADYFNMTDDVDRADSLYRWILENGRTEVPPLLRLRALVSLGRLFDKRESFLDALKLYRDALETARLLGFHRSEAVVLNNLGLDEIRVGRVRDGRSYLERAMVVAESCGEDWLFGYIYYGLGSSYEAQHNLPAAVEYFRRAMEFHRVEGNLWGELGSKLRVAYLLVEMGDYDEALKEYDYCVDRYEKMGSLYGLSWALGGRALCRHRLGMFDSAERDYTRCLGLRKKLGDRRGAAWALHSLGMLYDLSSQHGKALTAYNRALSLYREVGDTGGEGVSLFGLGSAYYYIGRLRQSIDYYRRALAVAEDVSDTELEYRVLSGLGSAYMNAGEFVEAERCYKRCFEITGGSSNAVSVVWSSNNLASLYVKMGDRARARAFIEIAGSYARMGAFDYLRAQSLYIESLIETELSNKAERLKEAVSIARKSSMPGILWRALSDLGEVRMKEGRKAEAVRLEEEAALEVERIVRALGSFEHRGSMLEISFTPYRRLVQYLLQDNGGSEEDVFTALETVERARTLATEILLGEAPGGEGTRDGKSKDELRKNRLLAKLSSLQYILQDPELNDMRRIKVITIVKELERELESIEIEESSGVEMSRRWISGVKIKELLGEIKEDETVLSYFLCDGGTYLFVARKNRLKVYRLAPPGRIKEMINHYLEILEETGDLPRGIVSTVSVPGNADIERSESPADYKWDGHPYEKVPSSSAGSSLPLHVFVQASRKVFDELLGEAVHDAGFSGRLVVIPDGVINKLPFATLIGPEGFLIERHSIVMAPSIKSLVSLRKRAAASLEGALRRPYDMVSFGCVGVQGGRAGSNVRVLPFNPVPVQPLLNAEREAVEVAGYFKRSIACTGRLARESEFKRFPLERARLIHIASHSYIDDMDARRSFIVMNEPDVGPVSPYKVYFEEGKNEGSREDGILQWNEIAGLKLNALLVSLSGCRSARGVISSGEGVRGVAQAFMHAGSGAVLASLLDVPDAETSRFMDCFYEGVRRGLDFAESLRMAQLKSLEMEGLSSPAVWGAFTIIGAGDLKTGGVAGTDARRRFSGVQVVAAVLAVALLVLIIYRGAVR